jgi:uncharacterized protein
VAIVPVPVADQVSGENPFFTHGGREATRRKALCTIIVDGVDVTARLDPHLLSVTVVDKMGGSADTAAIELDDRDARLTIPPDNGTLQVWIGWHNEGQYLVFEGFVKEVESGFSRKQGGRRLWIDGRGVDTSGDATTPRQQTWGDGAPPGQAEGEKVPLSQVLKDAAKASNMTMTVGPEFDKIKRDFWAQTNVSFMQFGASLAREVGGVFKISGNKAAFVSPAPQGESIEAIWGKNLLEWRIKPFVGRPQAAAAVTKYFDLQQSIWQQTKKAIGGDLPFGRASRVDQLPAPAATANNAEHTNDAMSADSNASRGTGWCLINGEPRARAGAPLILQGARPGVNGQWTIDECEHHYTRAGGYVTRCTLRNPILIRGDYEDTWRKNPAVPNPPQE